MTPADHWQNILLSNPQFRSTNKNGWDFTPYEPKKRGSAVWPVLAGIVCALIVCAVILTTGVQNV